MKVNSVTIRRAAKINTGNYENTDVSIELTASVEESQTAAVVAAELIAQAEFILRNKIDDIELGKRKVESKAKRFGV